MSRYRLTFAVALTLTAVYQMYAQWAEAFTRIESIAARPAAEEQVSPPPETFVAMAQQYLPHVAWQRNPKFTFQRQNELFIFAGTVALNRDDGANSPGSDAGRQIRLEPFALIWIDPQRPQAEPLVICCDTARVQFENPVRLGFDGGSLGRLTAAWFDGQVDITGPDGLHLQGQNFNFSEESRSIYTAQPVTFAYGPTPENSSRVRGAADQLLVNLGPSTDPLPDPAMPRVGAVQRIRLLKQIVLDCEYEEEHDNQPPEPASAHIRCDESLEFDAVQREATLLKNVYVRRPTGGEKRPDEADTLRCHQLALRFVERETPTHPGQVDPGSEAAATADRSPTSSAAGHNPLAGLHVEQVVASGSDRGDRVLLRSDAQRITAHMERLQYDMAARTAVLSDQNAAVEVDWEGTQLRSQVIHIIPDSETRSHVVTCLGRGQLKQPDPDSGAPLLEATWNERLHAAPDPKTGLLLVQLSQDVKLIMQQRAGIRAEHVNVWIDETGLRQVGAAKVAPQPGPGEELAAGAASRLPIRYVEAQGGVIMANAEMRVETELLQATIEPDTLPYETDEEHQLVGDERSSPSQPGGDERSSRSQPGESWQLNSHSVVLKLLSAPESREVQIAEAHADGNVRITQTVAAEPTSRTGQESLTLSGVHLDLVNGGDVHQFVTVTGAPARLQRGDLLLECRNLQLDRSGNRATVQGAGSLQAPVDRDLNGANVTEPLTLNVNWEAGVTFDGELAAFRKHVKLQLHDRILQCDEMDVRLNEPLRFTDEQPGSHDIAIRDISCRNGVQVEIYDWQENRIVGIRKARLTQFLVDYQSGAFQGDGPGTINHWSQRDGRRIAIANRRTAQPNAPAESDALDWEHISVEFDDLLLGNFRNHTAELHGRVRTIYAPVGRISETFDRDDLSGASPSVEHAVWLGCDVMNIELDPVGLTAPAGENRNEQRLNVVANGRCELEGQKFHARAESLSYEEEKSLFMLRGKGDQQASIQFQDEPGAEPRRVSGKIIQFIPSEGGQVRLEGSRGFQGSQ